VGARQFSRNQVVASDDLRALVGEHRDDQRAGTTPSPFLDLVIERRSRRGLITVVDTVGLDARRRRSYIEAAHARGVSCHAVVFDTPPDVCLVAQQGAAGGRFPPPRSRSQLRAAADVWDVVPREGFERRPTGPVRSRSCPPTCTTRPPPARRQEEESTAHALRTAICHRSLWEGRRAA